MTIKDQIENLIRRAFQELDLKPDVRVVIPPMTSFGDYSAIIGSKIMESGDFMAATAIHKDFLIKIREKIKEDKFYENCIERSEVAESVYINFFTKPALLQKRFKEIVREKEDFGKTDISKGKTIIIDYSSPNVAKPMHVGHLRSTIIGQSLYNIYKFLGYKVIGDNHIGDWGTQFGAMIAACKRYKVNLEIITIKKMLDIYVRFSKEIEKNPELQEKAKEEFKKLEDGDKRNREIWKILRQKSLKEFEKIYKILGIRFNLVLGESFYEKDLKEIIENALKKKIAIKNPDNSVIILLDKFNLIPCLIQKSDGATLYETRDLATIKYRVSKYRPERILYVVGNEQSLHFEQLFYCAELLNYISRDKLYHIKFGLILDENRKKLASRKGRFIGAEDLIDRIIDLAEKVIKVKNPKLSSEERKKAARIIGVGALKYNDLSQTRNRDIVFDWRKMLNFEGNSASYLQYSYVRLRSILRKTELANFEPKFLKEKEELEIIKQLDLFPTIIQEVTKEHYINILAGYLFKLANLVNNFYEKHPVLKAEKDIKLARLALIKAVTIVLKNGLNLLGIETLERM